MISRYITEDVTEKVLSLLDEYATGQLGTDLSWARLEKAFGYSRQALSANQTIKNKFKEAKRSLKDHKKGALTVVANAGELEWLRKENIVLKNRIAEYEKRFKRWINNCHKRGINPLDLDAPIGISPKTAYRSRENVP